jgi:putative SOS response-associated peptidase YedK
MRIGQTQFLNGCSGSAGKKSATFNARAETVADKPMFRDAFRRTRCLIPASGYYEWATQSDGKQPYYITPADGLN